MADALPLRIFLASPGDLTNERQALQACVDEYNARRADDSQVTFEIVAGNQVRGTARRAQGAIDELLGESHYLVALFKEAWGSEPGSPWGYTSGTEEELFTGLLELGREEQPMRDVWVGFVASSSADSQVIALKTQFVQRHSMMFEELQDLRDLKDKFADRLVAWGASASYKVPRWVDLLPSSGRDVLRAANLRLRGEKLISLGQAEPGAKNLKEAAAIGGPDEQLAYAKFLARDGQLDEAYASTQRAVDFFTSGSMPLFTAQAAQAFAAQAGVLRRQRRYLEAVGRLEQALSLLRDSDVYTEKVRCRILDDLGLALLKTGELASARIHFESALASRRELGIDFDISQSLVNLARLEVLEESLAAAAAYAEEAIKKLSGKPPTALHANVEVLAAQVLLRQGRAAEGVAHADRALALNRQIASKNGEAIAELLLAQCYRAQGSRELSIKHAQACFDLNDSMGNETGKGRAQWILDQLRT
jgi:tetratricopeptide (TPR) repeat protein